MAILMKYLANLPQVLAKNKKLINLFFLLLSVAAVYFAGFNMSADFAPNKAVGSDLVYRYLNISLLAFAGLIVFSFVQFRSGLTILQLMKIVFAMTFSLIFEFSAAFGLLSIFGLAGLRLGLATLLSFYWLLFVSILIKFVNLKTVQEKIKGGSKDMAEQWKKSLGINKGIFEVLIVLVVMVTMPAGVFLSGTVSAAIMIILNTLIAVYSSLMLMPDLLNLRLKLNANIGSNKRKSR